MPVLPDKFAQTELVQPSAPLRMLPVTELASIHKQIIIAAAVDTPVLPDKPALTELARQPAAHNARLLIGRDAEARRGQ